ncbi:MAG: hypothetical protein QOK36_4245 [Gaiellales bacterium]|jgi:hypothetical protein|nr:hypothetical protein [Gaiellales bacterium]
MASAAPPIPVDPSSPLRRARCVWGAVEHPESGYPQVAISGPQGMLRRTVDCAPATQPRVYLVSEPIDAGEGEAIVVAFAGGDLRQVQSFADLRTSH